MITKDSLSIEEARQMECEREFLGLRSARRPRIVVAEDCADVSQALLPFLRRSNYLVRIAGDGIEALEAIQETEPDALLLDLGLPRLHGLKLLHRLRSREGRIDLPVVVLTGDTDPESWERALRSGARKVLLKPTPARVVVAVLDRLLLEG